MDVLILFDPNDHSDPASMMSWPRILLVSEWAHYTFTNVEMMCLRIEHGTMQSFRVISVHMFTFYDIRCMSDAGFFHFIHYDLLMYIASKWC